MVDLPCVTPPPPRSSWTAPTQRHITSKRSGKECKWVCKTTHCKKAHCQSENSGKGGDPGMYQKGERHLPFQVLDASAIEGIRGLVGESTSIYSCIQIYKALTPPAPPSVSRRDGRTWASLLRGILRGVTLPRSRAVRSIVRTHRSGCGGLGVPPSRWLHLPSEAQAQEPPPVGRHTGCRAPVLQGAPLAACPTCCPATPCRIAAYLCLPSPPTEGGGGAAVHRGERWTTLSLTPLTQSSSLWLPLCLQHSTPCSILLPQILPCSTLLPLFAEGWGGTWILPSSKPPCSPPAARSPGEEGVHPLSLQPAPLQ